MEPLTQDMHKRISESEKIFFTPAMKFMVQAAMVHLQGEMPCGNPHNKEMVSKKVTMLNRVIATISSCDKEEIVILYTTLFARLLHVLECKELQDMLIEENRENG